jgi:hypothetical protein
MVHVLPKKSRRLRVNLIGRALEKRQNLDDGEPSMFIAVKRKKTNESGTNQNEGTSGFFRSQKLQIIGRMGQCTTDRQSGLANAIENDQMGRGIHKNREPEWRHKSSPSVLQRRELGCRISASIIHSSPSISKGEVYLHRLWGSKAFQWKSTVSSCDGGAPASPQHHGKARSPDKGC